MMKMVVRVMVGMMVVMVHSDMLCDHAPAKPSAPSQEPLATDASPAYREWLRYSRRLVKHLHASPDTLNLTQLRPHLRTLLKDLDFLPRVRSYLDDNLPRVVTARDARVLFTLLDLYSALEKKRQQYLKQVQKKFVMLMEMFRGFGRDSNPFYFVVNGFNRHLKRVQRDTTDLYLAALEPGPRNMALVAHYWPGRLLALDQALKLHNVSTFVEMGASEWYQIHPSAQPDLALSLDQEGRPVLVNTSLPHHKPRTLFGFREFKVKFGAVRYLLFNAILPAASYLRCPCYDPAARRVTMSMCFGTQGYGGLEIAGLPGEERAIIHKTRGDLSVFLTWSLQRPQVRSNHTCIPKVEVSIRYPGHSAHWVMQAQTSSDLR